MGSSLLFPALLGMIVAMVYVPLQALRAGLLTRFFGTLGMALGVSLILLPPAPVLLALWFGYLGLLFVGRVPGGRPPAWEAGEAIPWPRPGEEPSPRLRAQRRGDRGRGDRGAGRRRTAQRLAEAQAQAPTLSGPIPSAYDGQGRKEIAMTHDEHEPLAGKRAAVMVGPLFEDPEAIYPYYRLQEAGATVG